MRKFNYLKLKNLFLSTNILKTIEKIHEYKGRQTLYLENHSSVLNKMSDIAKIQSTKSSNAIEGIYAKDARLDSLMKNKIEPKNRDEEEIVGYRRVLDIIHESYEHIDFNKNNVLTLHNQLYYYSDTNYKGKFKTTDNTIAEIDAFGNKKVRFQPVISFETENYFNEMTAAYELAVKEKVQPLILIPALIHDFLCIHPFDDGNGRMSRLLTLLLLYKSGYLVGRYISIEMLIEETKDTYYEVLQNSSENWHTGDNNSLPFIKYMLGILIRAYRDCEDRFNLIKGKLTPTEKVFSVMQNSLTPLSKKEITHLCLDISTRTIERALKELQDIKKIKQIGSSRATKYIKI